MLGTGNRIIREGITLGGNVMNGLFSVSKNEKLVSLFAPVSGRVIAREEIPDEAFASGILGEGLGIVPRSGELRSPVKGTVIDVTPTLHAYSILSDDGAEILLHIGIDTVEMKGKGFEAFVKAGDRVEVGALLGNADLNLIRTEGYSTVIAVIIINSEVLSQATVFEGECKVSESEIFKYVMRKEENAK